MKEEHDTCPYEKVYAVQFGALTKELKELKERVKGLESTLTRGMLLLVANLAGVIMTLVRELFRS